MKANNCIYFQKAIDVEKEDKEFEEALINIDGIGTVDVQRTSTSTCANMDINVEFTSVPGDRPLMTVITYDMLVS